MRQNSIFLKEKVKAMKIKSKNDWCFFEKPSLISTKGNNKRRVKHGRPKMSFPNGTEAHSFPVYGNSKSPEINGDGIRNIPGANMKVYKKHIQWVTMF